MGASDTHSTDESAPETVRRYRRVLVLVAVALAPWTAVSANGFVSWFLPIGIVNLDPLELTTIFEYYLLYTRNLPPYLNAWGLSVVVFFVGLVSALVGLVWREDARVTASMFVLAGIGQLVFALGFFRRGQGYAAVPIGTLLLWGVVWRYYRRDLASIFQFPDGTE
ncbi:TIGR04206 family protein [Halorientalis pallida]|uniref:TIGR04206 family protein n=1 Tax=Halorientalis pallida TaxID=2479928 RepID=A0A498KZK3_9EURY|nr:TIGR04206 family protein [Halorientalis pallida]RXK51499.1 TIGR04206 family protein [Halorientalis pallida]